MKHLIFGVMAAAALVASAAAEKDPAFPYEDYGPAMASEAGDPMAVEWHNAHAAELGNAVSDEALAAFVKDEASAKALLAQVKGAYGTDPLVAIQIAAVSQWTVALPEPCWLCFWKESRAGARKIWVKALLERAETAEDDYVKLFCLDQLRWCGCKCPCVAKRIRAVGAAARTKPVKDMAALVADGLER